MNKIFNIPVIKAKIAEIEHSKKIIVKPLIMQLSNGMLINIPNEQHFRNFHDLMNTFYLNINSIEGEEVVCNELLIGILMNSQSINTFN